MSEKLENLFVEVFLWGMLAFAGFLTLLLVVGLTAAALGY